MEEDRPERPKEEEVNFNKPQKSEPLGPLAEVDKMRSQIRQLQEKRSAAMMNEVVELQKERDIAVGRVKILKQTLEGR